jgi:hypothetical protein
MNIVLYTKDLVRIKTSKGFILSNFIQWNFLNRSSWYNETIRINLSNNICQPIQFGQPSLWDIAASEHLFIGVNDFRNSIWLNNHIFKFTSENSLDLVKERSIFHQRSLKLSKLKSFSGAPEVLLLDEILMAKEINS